MGSHHSLTSLKLARVPKPRRLHTFKLWNDILSYSFDSLSFSPLKNFPDIYATEGGYFISKELLMAITLEFKRFLFLAAYAMPNQDMVPPPLVDRLWRLVLTSSELYNRFCERVLRPGEFLHRSSKQILSLKNYQATRERYAQLFGRDPPCELWPDVSSQEELESAHRFFRLKPSIFQKFKFQFLQNDSDVQQGGSVALYQKYSSKIRDIYKNVYLLKVSSSDLDEAEKVTSEELKEKLDKQRSYIEENRNQGLEDIPEAPNDEMEETNRKAKATLRPKSFLDRPSGSKIGQAGLDDTSVDNESLDDVEEQPHLEDEEPFDDDSEREEAEEEEELKVSDTKFKERTSRIKDSISAIAEIIENEGDPDRLRKDWESILQRMEQACERLSLSGHVGRAFKLELIVGERETSKCFRELKRFLIIREIVRDTVRVIPSVIVMLLWEYMLAETEYYKNFCNLLRGKYIDSLVLPRMETPEQRKQYRVTLELYRAVFVEEPPEFFWEKPIERFDYDEVYSFKFLSMWDYIRKRGESETEETEKLKTKKTPGKIEFCGPHEEGLRRAAVGAMAVHSETKRVWGFFAEDTFGKK